MLNNEDMLRAECAQLKLDSKMLQASLAEATRQSSMVTQFLCAVLHREHLAGRTAGLYELTPDDLDAAKTYSLYRLQLQYVKREDGDRNVILSLQAVTLETGDSP